MELESIRMTAGRSRTSHIEGAADILTMEGSVSDNHPVREAELSALTCESGSLLPVLLFQTHSRAAHRMSRVSDQFITTHGPSRGVAVHTEYSTTLAHSNGTPFRRGRRAVECSC